MDLLAWRRHWKPDLKAAKWAPCKVNEKTLLIKSHFADEAYQIMVYDGARVLHEDCSRDQFLRRTKVLNPNIEVPSSTLLHHLQNNMSEEEISHSISKLTTNEDDDTVTIHVGTQLEGSVPFTWQFHLQEASYDQSADHLTTPLMTMVAELFRRQKELCKIVRRKDVEIDDYKAAGAKVSRRHLETTPFDDKIFTNDMNESKDFGSLMDQNCSTEAFQDVGQALYRQVMMRDAYNNAQVPSRDNSDEEFDDDFSGDGAAPTGTTGPSWGRRLPPSLVAAAQTTGGATNQSPIRGSPKKSPKVISPGRSSEDTELMRRQALEKKLAEELSKQKNKKKKKKLF